MKRILGTNTMRDRSLKHENSSKDVKATRNTLRVQRKRLEGIIEQNTQLADDLLKKGETEQCKAVLQQKSDTEHLLAEMDRTQANFESALETQAVEEHMKEANRVLAECDQITRDVPLKPPPRPAPSSSNGSSSRFHSAASEYSNTLFNSIGVWGSLFLGCVLGVIAAVFLAAILGSYFWHIILLLAAAILIVVLLHSTKVVTKEQTQNALDRGLVNPVSIAAVTYVSLLVDSVKCIANAIATQTKPNTTQLAGCLFHLSACACFVYTIYYHVRY